MDIPYQLGIECDQAISSNSIETIDLKIQEVKSLLNQNESDSLHLSLLHYFIGNLFIAKSSLVQEKYDDWTNKNFPSNGVEAINHLRIAYKFSTQKEHYIRFEIQTNLANCLCKFGRYIEAIQLWLCDFSHEGDNPFVSIYRKANTLRYLATFIDSKYTAYDYKFKAYGMLKILKTKVEGEIIFSKHIELMSDADIVGFIKQGNELTQQGAINIEEEDTSNQKYGNNEEKLYSEWCLENNLFLNHLNDITNIIIARFDIIQFPSHTTSIFDGPYLLEAFSAIKREFSFARFLLYEGIFQKNCPEYEYRNLYLTDTGGGIYYEMNIEKIKTSMRLAFSIFDKLMNLMIVYFEGREKLSKRIAFQPKFIRENIKPKNNPFITSLYWLACDLTDINPNTSNIPWEAPNPDSKKLREIRNALEHSWLRVTDGPSIWEDRSGFNYAYEINKEDLLN